MVKDQETLSLYFKGSPADTTFTCNAKTVETAKNGEYVVARIRGIKASELENNFTVTFEDGRVKYNAIIAIQKHRLYPKAVLLR